MTTLILVVDDDVHSARPLVRLLRDDGFDVELELDGNAAIARLGRVPTPDVLVTDYRMPHADGVAVAQYARTLRADIPVLFVTAYPEVTSFSSARSLAPPAMVFAKPLDYGAFSAELRRVAAASARQHPA